ncbi:fatty acid synthase subunit beta, partial [Apiospora phragmitis]
MASSDENTSCDEIRRSPEMFDTPGSFTPETTSTMSAFSISHQSVQVELSLPPSEMTQLSEFRRDFQTLLDQTGESSDIKPPFSEASMAFRFLEVFYLGREIDLLAWLEDPAKRPDKSFLAGAAVSFLIIGIGSLLHYSVICQMLGKSPGELGQVLTGTTGHFQGIVLAAAVAKAHDWESFFVEAKWAVELLFWIGYESQMAAPQSSLSPAMISDSVENGEGVPSHMLLVRGLPKGALEDVIAAGNKHLPEEERVYLSLVNSATDHVVAGPQRSLRGLVLRLREIRARDGLDQSRVPWSKRKPVISLVFLPVSAPFHAPYLQGAADRIVTRMSSSWPETAHVTDLRAPVFDTEKRTDLRAMYGPEANLTQLLAVAITTKVVDWPKALRVDEGKYSHIITLGIGRFAGMVLQNLDGRGVHVIDGTRPDSADTASMGDKAEIFAPTFSLSAQSWEKQFRPRLVRSADGAHYRVETRLSQILKAPPIIVPGMTPTTVAWDFVVSVTKAGYHIELAGSGYWNPADMTAAIEKVAAKIPAGRSITCNLIYVDPVAIGFQIPLIRQLISSGVPIRGLTIGAGVPSPEVAAQCTLRFQSSSSGPAAAAAAITLARTSTSRFWRRTARSGAAEPLPRGRQRVRGRRRHVPLLLGGLVPPVREAGHAVRRHTARKPDDGGHRRAHRPGVKSLLVKAPGVDDAEWEKSYLSPDAAGGVLTVTSEMGQSIHKVATRGVRLSREMDDTIFSLPKSERKAALRKRKDEIVRRLNADFAKPCHQQRWVDVSYRDLFAEFATRSLERQGSPVTFDPSLLSEPEVLVAELTRLCPGIAEQLLHPEDVRFFSQSCKKRGRKPVNFIVAFDDDFEQSFKKDSLWQSEDLERVLGQDLERVCILQSPVSVRHSTRDDQSSKEILDEIHNDLVALMGDFKELGSIDTQSVTTLVAPIQFNSDEISVEETGDHIVLRPMQGRDLPSPENWMECLKSFTCAAIFALVQQATLFEVETKRSRPNPFRTIFGARHGYSLVLSRDLDQESLRHDATAQTVVCVKADTSSGHLHVELIHGEPVPATLIFQWEFNKHTMQLIDSTTGRDGRIKVLYAHLWLGKRGPKTENLTERFLGGDFKLARELQSALCSAVLHAFSVESGTVSHSKTLPLEAAVVAAWGVLMRPLLVSDLDGDILRLVHQSIGIEYVPSAPPMRIDESVTTESSVRAVTIQPSGKSIAVEARLLREGRHIATVTSEFFIRGRFSDHRKTFRHKQEPAMELKVGSKVDEAVLRHRSWLQLDDPSVPLVGKTLVFRIESHSQWTDNKQIEAPNLSIRGTVEHVLWNGGRHKIGSVSCDSPSSLGNPVMDFLQRKGKAVGGKVPLKAPGWSTESEVTVVMPSHTQLYTEVSGDRNPIHASPIFAELAELPGPIMHGMYTAAVCRKVVEDLVVPREPDRMRRFDAAFVGMVRPVDRLVVGLSHVAMNSGRMVFEVVARQEESGEEVLRGEVEVEQPSTAYLFTAKAIYDEMDSYIKNTYGWSILQIIRENPKELTVHFRGRQGQRVLQNYLAMTSEVVEDDGTRRSMPIIPGLSRDSTSHTFADARGLCYSRRCSPSPPSSWWSGPPSRTCGRAGSFRRAPFSPATRWANFDDKALRRIVRHIHQASGQLLEIVNFNVEGGQYVCAGHKLTAHSRTQVRNLYCLTEILDAVAAHKVKPESVQEFLSSPQPNATDLGAAITEFIEHSKTLPLEVELRRGKATIPLAGIDVPFHSSRLQPGVPAWRDFLRSRIKLEGIHPERLVDRFIPNVVGKPFSLSSAFVKEAAEITQSPTLQRLV